jgi:catechol 2,3-dioxygenase
MPGFSLSPETTLGLVALTVGDMTRSLDFYQNILGFQLHRRTGDSAFLGVDGRDLLSLTERPGARRVPRTTGLYHFAVLVPSRLDLARVLRRIVESHTPTQGFADHLVSEAIYLSDPDGNGIEVYRDRPRSSWYDADGRLRMGTDPLDVAGLLAELNGQNPAGSSLPPETRIGHVHLHVADLDAAIAFYRDTLGFELMMRYGPSAAFLSVGGYHHHIGVNTWAGVGAPTPPPDAVGLRYFTLLLPDETALSDLRTHLEAAGVRVDEDADELLVRDPSGNGILLRHTRA